MPEAEFSSFSLSDGAKSPKQLNRGCRMTKCVICERRPANDGAYCTNCLSKIDSERKARAKHAPKYFLTYRGHVVGLYPDGKDKLKGRLLNRDPNRLPKSKTLNLNHYIEGFSREQIKNFKSCVLQLAHA